MVRGVLLWVRCWLLVVASTLLSISGCTGVAGPEHVLNMAPDGELAPNSSGAGTPDSSGAGVHALATPKVRVELPETAPGDVEKRPFMNIKLEIMDGQTEQPIAANVHFAIRDYGEAEYKDDRRDVCGFVSSCRLEVPATDRVVYKIEVERVGYKLWAVEVRTRSLSTRTMYVPVRLVRDAGSVRG